MTGCKRALTCSAASPPICCGRSAKAPLRETERSRWARELDRVDDERDAHDEQLRAVDARLAALAVELGEAQRAMYLSEEEPAELVGHVELTVEAAPPGRSGCA